MKKAFGRISTEFTKILGRWCRYVPEVCVCGGVFRFTVVTDSLLSC